MMKMFYLERHENYLYTLICKGANQMHDQFMSLCGTQNHVEWS